MAISLTDNTIAMWCVHHLNNANWMACLTRTGPTTFVLYYRFRYYVDDKLGRDSEDKRNWYHGEFNGTEQDALAGARELFNVLQRATDAPGWELLKGERTIKEFIEVLGTMPYIHISTEKKA